MSGKDARSTPFDYVLSHYSRWDDGLASKITSMMLRNIEGTHETDRSDDGVTLLHMWQSGTVEATSFRDLYPKGRI